MAGCIDKYLSLSNPIYRLLHLCLLLYELLHTQPGADYQRMNPHEGEYQWTLRGLNCCHQHSPPATYNFCPASCPKTFIAFLFFFIPVSVHNTTPAIESLHFKKNQFTLLQRRPTSICFQAHRASFLSCARGPTISSLCATHLWRPLRRILPDVIVCILKTMSTTDVARTKRSSSDPPEPHS